MAMEVAVALAVAVWLDRKELENMKYQIKYCNVCIARGYGYDV